MLVARVGNGADEESFDCDVEAARAAVWRECLIDCPSVLGRLARLASYHDSESGHYREKRIVAAFGEVLADAVLKEWHERTFAIWIELLLPQHWAEFQLFLNTQIACNPREIVRAWRTSNPYRQFPPASALDMER